MKFGKIFKAFYDTFNHSTSTIEEYFNNHNRVSMLTRKEMITICRLLRHLTNVDVRNDYMRLTNAELIKVTYKAMKNFEQTKH